MGLYICVCRVFPPRVANLQDRYSLLRSNGTGGPIVVTTHNLDDGDSKCLWNIGELLPDNTAPQFRRQPSSVWKEVWWRCWLILRYSICIPVCAQTILSPLHRVTRYFQDDMYMDTSLDHIGFTAKREKNFCLTLEFWYQRVRLW
jgi:hypothetical protein